MSFYFDDYNDLGGSSQALGVNKEEDDDDNFVCENCGSTDSYLDRTTGNLFCSSCYTQSQNAASQHEVGLDYEEIMGLAARGKGGNVLKKNLHGYTKKAPRKRKPLEELDRSKPLPDLKKCISGFQTVLREGAKCIATILEMDDEELKHYLKTIKTLWLAYLRAWKDGAEKYGALFPEMRFSLRDCFLTAAHKYQIKLVLAYKASKELEANHEQHGSEVLDQETSSNDGSKSAVQNNPEPPLSSGNLKQDSHATTSYDGVRRGRKVTNVQQLAECFPKGREESALALNVSMYLAVSILWVPIARIGIIPGQIINWVANGSLPFVDAFEQLLSPEEQETLRTVSAFFQIKKPPTSYIIEKKAAYLAVAAGLKSPASLGHGIHGRAGVSDDQTAIDDAEATRRSDEEGETPNGDTQRTVLTRRIRFVAAECVPHMIAQLIADLGFGQRVLDIALSLIGTKPLRDAVDEADDSTQSWLPPALQRAHPVWVDSPEYAVALIAVACKMCPGWEHWSFVRCAPGPDRELARKKSKLEPMSPVSNSIQHNDDAVGNRRDGTKGFIPWNEGQFRLMRNDDLKNYLDFSGDHVRGQNQDEEVPKFEALTTTLEKTSKGIESSTTTQAKSRMQLPWSGSGEAVMSNVTSLRPSNATKIYRGISQDFLPYLSYPNYETHAKSKRTRSTRYLKLLTPEPFHPFYVRLVEYIAYKTHTEAWRIHEIVAALDEEVVALCERQEFEDVEIGKPQNVETTRRRKRGGLSWAIMLNPAHSSARYTAYEPVNKADLRRRRKYARIQELSNDNIVVPEKPDSAEVPYLGGEQPPAIAETRTDEGGVRFAEV